MLKLSEIGKLSKQFARTCCYKNLQSHLLATQKCCPRSSSASTARQPSQPIRIPQHAGLCQLGRKTVTNCANSDEFQQSIWAASKNSGVYVPDQATSWYKRQRNNRLNRHSLLEQCKCNGISSFVPPEECFKYQLRQCVTPLKPSQYKRISPEFLNILQNYEYLTAFYDPNYHMNGYNGTGLSMRSDLSATRSRPTSPCKAEPVKKIRPVRPTEKKSSSALPRTTHLGHPKAHGFKWLDEIDDQEEETQSKKNKSPQRVIDAKNQPKKNEKNKAVAIKKPQKSETKLPCRGECSKKEQISNCKPVQKTSVRELWTRPTGLSMRESGGSIEIKRNRGKYQSSAVLDSDSNDEEAKSSMTKFRPRLHRNEYSTFTVDLPALSRGHRGRVSKNNSTSKLKKHSAFTKCNNSPAEFKQHAHCRSDSIKNVPGKRSSLIKTSNAKSLWSSRSPSTDREETSLSLKRKPSVTEMNPTVHGFSKYGLMKQIRNTSSMRKQSSSPKRIRTPSEHDDDSDVIKSSHPLKMRNLNNQRKISTVASNKRSTSTSSPHRASIKKNKKTNSNKENFVSLAPSINAFKRSQTSKRTLSTALDLSSTSGRKISRWYHTGVTSARSNNSGSKRRRSISSSASESSMSPRVHAYRQYEPIKSTKQETRTNSLSSISSGRQAKKVSSRSPTNSRMSPSDCLCVINPPKNHEPIKAQKNRNIPSRHHDKGYEQIEKVESVKKNKTPFMRPGLHGFRHHKLSLDNDENTTENNYYLPNTMSNEIKASMPSAENVQTKPRIIQHSTSTSKFHALQSPTSKFSNSQLKPFPQNQTTVAAFTTNINYNPDRSQDLFYECNRSSSSPLESDSSCHSLPKPIHKICKQTFKFADSDNDDPRLEVLNKIHHYQDIPPDLSTHHDPNPKLVKYINSNSILRKCLNNPSQSETALSTECEERVIRFSEPCDRTSRQPSPSSLEDTTYLDQVSNAKKDSTCLYPCKVLCECSKFNCDDLNGRRNSNSESRRSSQSSKRSSLDSNAPRHDTSTNIKRHSHCYGDSIDWHHADHLFPNRYRDARRRSEQEDQILAMHKSKNRARSRYSSVSEDSVERHKICPTDWANINRNYPQRFQEAAHNLKAEQQWRELHRIKTKRMSQGSPVVEERHTRCSVDASDWRDVTENYPARYQMLAARQEAEKRSLQRHSEKNRSILSEQQTVKNRIAALEAASGKKVKTTHKSSKTSRSSSPASSLERRPNRNATNRTPNSILKRPNENLSPYDRSRTRSPSSTEDQTNYRHRLSTGYYRSPTYLQNAPKSRIPIALSYAQNNKEKEATYENIASVRKKNLEKKDKHKRMFEQYKPLGPDYVLGQRRPPSR